VGIVDRPANGCLRCGMKARTHRDMCAWARDEGCGVRDRCRLACIVWPWTYSRQVLAPRDEGLWTYSRTGAYRVCLVSPRFKRVTYRRATEPKLLKHSWEVGTTYRRADAECFVVALVWSAGLTSMDPGMRMLRRGKTSLIF
jgi:hypothetical protein